jgi:acyl-CoA thioesterase II
MFDPSPTDAPNRFVWEPSQLLLTPSGALQGGAGLGATLAAMQMVTGRPVIWATAQYLSFAAGIEPLDLEVTVEVSGHNTTQARCTLSRDGREILTSHAALGSRSSELRGVWCQRPDVPAPDDCPRYRYFERGRGGLGDIADHRLAVGRQLADIDGTPGNGTFAMWIRAWSGSRTVTVADLAFLGDFMPMAFADALGAPYAGNSLDNTIRVGDLTATGWVLLVAHVQQVTNGFGYGHAELWAEDGTLLGDVSQSAIMRQHAKIGTPRSASRRQRFG